jgi:hypothetical protein
LMSFFARMRSGLPSRESAPRKPKPRVASRRLSSRERRRLRRRGRHSLFDSRRPALHSASTCPCRGALIFRQAGKGIEGCSRGVSPTTQSNASVLACGSVGTLEES